MSGGVDRYRGDIDGLRAVAVLSIIAYHLHAMPLKGAFVTLDIFFVISGYLIGGHVRAAIETGTFSLTDFYVRRIRRIIPALVAMLVLMTIACLAIMYPWDLTRYGANLAATAVSASNFYFWATTDYFAPAAQSAPLLHTWSLAVEEQLYLLFPLLMLVLTRFAGKRTGVALWSILLVSLAVATGEAFTRPTLAFYWPHTRAWEFLLGTAILYVRLDALAHPYVREAVAVCGGLLIAVSICFLRESMPFPGVLALPACAGTALVMAAGSQGRTAVGRVLSIAPARFVGAISYSLYLWHWPFILLYKLAKPSQSLTHVDKAAVVIATFALGYLSWRFIEQPFRRMRPHAAATFGAATLAIAALAVTGLCLRASEGLPGRFDPRENRLAASQEDRAPPRAPGCYLQAGDRERAFTPTRCIARSTTLSNVLLFGDSHANHLWFGLSHLPGVNAMEAAVANCRPLLSSRASRDAGCANTTRFAFDDLAQRPDTMVLLSARWKPADAAPLAITLDWLRTRHIPAMVSGPIPEYDAPLPILLAASLHRHDAGLTARHLDSRIVATDAAIGAVAIAHGARYLSPFHALCSSPQSCQTLTPKAAPLQHDYGHLTRAGSDFLVKAMLAGSPLDTTRTGPASVQ